MSLLLARYKATSSKLTAAIRCERCRLSRPPRCPCLVTCSKLTAFTVGKLYVSLGLFLTTGFASWPDSWHDRLLYSAVNLIFYGPLVFVLNLVATRLFPRLRFYWLATALLIPMLDLSMAITVGDAITPIVRNILMILVIVWIATLARATTATPGTMCASPLRPGCSRSIRQSAKRSGRPSQR
jgi:hypothetical protein